jgi:hypothetical protein
MSPVTIDQARTIAALAALLEQSTTPRFPALVQLKPGTNRPNFLAHGEVDYPRVQHRRIEILELLRLAIHRAQHAQYGLGVLESERRKVQSARS